jgi:hypothetical protein
MSDVEDRGRMDCMQDDCENCHFASIGGLNNRDNPQAPHYIKPDDAEGYLKGYVAQAREMYGEDWRTCTFTWKHAMTIEPREKYDRD